MTVVVSGVVVLSKGLVVVLVSWFVALDWVVLEDIEWSVVVICWVVDVVIICVLVVGFNVFTVGWIVAIVSWVGVLDGVIEDVDWVAVVDSVVITWFVVVMGGEIDIFGWEEAIVCLVV